MTDSNETGYTKRRHPRLKANVHTRPTKVIGRTHPVPNISLGGMRIFSNTHFKQGETVHIELSFADGHKATELARIAWVDAYHKDSDFTYESGLEFIHVPSCSLGVLKSRIEKSAHSLKAFFRIGKKTQSFSDSPSFQDLYLAI